MEENPLVPNWFRKKKHNDECLTVENNEDPDMNVDGKCSLINKKARVPRGRC